MKKFFALSCALLLSSNALASEHSSPYVNVTEIRSLVNGDVYFSVDNPTAMCNTSVFLLKTSDPNAQAAFSTLISAATIKKKIKIENWTGCNEGGWGSLAEAISIQP